MTKTRRVPLHLILLLPPTVILALHGYLGYFTRLLADDFCSVYYAQRFGLFRSIWYWRLNWSGRYTAFAADWFLSEIWRTRNLSWMLIVLLFIWYLTASTGIYLTLRTEQTKKRNLLTSSILGALILFVIFSLTPNIPQSFYWWNGMRSYALPLIVLCVYFVFFGILLDKLNSNRHKMFLAVTSFLLFFGSGGMGETFVVYQFCLLAFLIITNWLPSHKFTWNTGLITLISGLLGTILSLVVIITAPGNAIRQGEGVRPPTTHIIKLISISWQGYLDFFYQFFLAPEKVAALISALLITAWLGKSHNNHASIQTWKIPTYILGGFLLSFVCFPPGVYGYSEPPPTRVLIIPVFALTVFWLYASFLAGAWLGKKGVRSNLLTQVIIVSGFLLLGYSSIIQARTLYQARDEYISFAQHWDAMDTQIWKAKDNHEESIEFPYVTNWAGLNTLLDNPKFWVNQCYSLYYGISVLGENPNE